MDDKKDRVVWSVKDLPKEKVIDGKRNEPLTIDTIVDMLYYYEMHYLELMEKRTFAGLTIKEEESRCYCKECVERLKGLIQLKDENMTHNDMYQLLG